MSKWRRTWQVGWRFGVCLLLLGWISHTIFLNEAQSAWERDGHLWAALGRWERWELAWSVGPRELWRTLTLVLPGALLLSLVFMGLTLILGVWRWRLVLSVHGLQMPLGRTMEISLIAHFFNSFLLGSTGGDLIKAYYAARETHHKKPEAVVTVVVDRLIGLFSMLLFAGLMMLINLPFLVKHRELVGVGWAVLAMLLLCGLVLGLMFWGGISRAWPRARQWLKRLPKGALLEQALDAGRSFGREKRFLLKAILLSFVINVVCVLQIATLAWGLGLKIPMLALFVIVPVIICISALPVTPSGLGVRENLYVLTLAGPGLQVPATEALSLSLLAYFGSLAWSVIGGIVYWAVRDRQCLDEVTRGDPAP